MMSKSKAGLLQFAEASEASSGTPLPITRGKGKRVGVAVRLSHEDWYNASEFALREQTSLQKLLVAGLSELMLKKGLPPLKGN
jgi:hypothetical protein